MATRICPQCGAQYVATVRRCIDCDVVLVDEPTTPDEDTSTASTSSPIGDGDRIGYELEGWGNQLKVTLEGMLDRAGIHRAWEAGALVVAAADEEAVDDLIATVEGDVVDLDDDVPRVALEIEDLDPARQDILDARLLADSIAHSWDEEGVLIVAEADEEQVLTLIEEVLETEPDEGDGLAAHEAMTAVYVAVDRLAKRPLDAKLGAALAEAAGALDAQQVPFGFSGGDWATLVADTDRLVARLAEARGGPSADDDEDGEGDGDDDGAAEADADADAVAEDGEVPADDGDDDGGVDEADDDDGVDEADEVVGDAEPDAEEADDEEDLESAIRSLRSRLAELV